MTDRADHLARTLIARLRALQTSLAEDGRGAPDRGQRIATLEKVLAVELGITGHATLATIESALPSLGANHPIADRDVAALAAFLRRLLGPQLAER